MSDWLFNLIKAYVLAEKLMNDVTKTILFKELSDIVERDYFYPENSPTLNAIQVIYNGTSNGDQVRQLFVQAYTDFGTANFFSQNVRVRGHRPRLQLQKKVRLLRMHVQKYHCMPTLEAYQQYSR